MCETSHNYYIIKLKRNYKVWDDEKFGQTPGGEVIVHLSLWIPGGPQANPSNSYSSNVAVRIYSSAFI